MAKEFKSNIQKPTDEQVHAFGAGRPFGKCRQCGLSIVASKVVCPECERLTEVGFGPVPRAPKPLPGQDTQPAQSYPSDDHAGYQDSIPNRNFPPNKERM
jgi:hypothetical protein